MTHSRPPSSILLDARWLHRGGAGRATELLLKGLQDLEPPGSWTLWGPPEVKTYLWPGARYVRTDSSPRSLAGQRGRRDMPPATHAIFMHQIRPLVWKPRSVVLFHDTIPLRTSSNFAVQAVRWSYLKMSATLARHILTVSAYSATRIEQDLRVPSSKITVIRYPTDPRWVTRVRRLRQTLPRADRAIYVGRFAAHKNLNRLMHAFTATSFAHAGGELVCVGGTRAEIDALHSVVPRGARITLMGTITQDHLDRLYATARLLILPSLEEGFGLPVLEAHSIGLPACVADAGALPELVPNSDLRFDPLDEADITRTIDRAVEIDTLQLETERAFPSPTAFAAAVCDVLHDYEPPLSGTP